jgi:hypothetical protein
MTFRFGEIIFRRTFKGLPVACAHRLRAIASPRAEGGRSRYLDRYEKVAAARCGVAVEVTRPFRTVGLPLPGRPLRGTVDELRPPGRAVAAG